MELGISNTESKILPVELQSNVIIWDENKEIEQNIANQSIKSKEEITKLETPCFQKSIKQNQI